jgi:hypothetical protein
VLYSIAIGIKNMKTYSLLICVWCIVALNALQWVRVWEDNFDWNGGVDLNKWDFDEGGDGWGL